MTHFNQNNLEKYCKQIWESRSASKLAPWLAKEFSDNDLASLSWSNLPEHERQAHMMWADKILSMHKWLTDDNFDEALDFARDWLANN